MKTPERTCVVCKKVCEKKNLLRIVKGTEGEISIDPTGRKNGRGAYICKSKECFLQLKKSKGLDRSFKMSVPLNVYDDLITEINSLIEG